MAYEKDRSGICPTIYKAALHRLMQISAPAFLGKEWELRISAAEPHQLKGRDYWLLTGGIWKQRGSQSGGGDKRLDQLVLGKPLLLDPPAVQEEEKAGSFFLNSLRARYSSDEAIRNYRPRLREYLRAFR